MGFIGEVCTCPTYYVYQLYKKFGETLLYSSSDDPDISIYAARRQDGALTLMVINLGPDEKHKPIRLENISPSSTATADVWLFDIDHQAEMIGYLSFGDNKEGNPTTTIHLAFYHSIIA